MGYRLTILLLFTLLATGCEEESGEKFVTLRNDETYALDLNISGDEEGAVITQQALHYEVSELVRDSTTGWSIVYRYIPEQGYTGIDYVEIETCTGGEGVSCSEIAIVSIRFSIIP